MGALSSLARRAVRRIRARYRGPTWDWPPSTVARLSYDTRDHALNGVALGAPFRRLEPFGPAAWFDRRRSELDLYYYRLGLSVSVRDDRVTSFDVIFDAAKCWEYEWHPLNEARVALRNPAGKWGDLTRSTTSDEVIALLGAPISTGSDEHEQNDEFRVADQSIWTDRDTRTGLLMKLSIDAPDAKTVAG